MSLQHALAVPMPHVLEKLGLKPTTDKPNESWYYSPFRDEKTPSFHVNKLRNVWFDFGEDKGGNVITFAILVLKQNGQSNSVKDAIRWINDVSGKIDPQTILQTTSPQKEAPKLALINKSKLEHQGLINYIEGRGIDIKLAKKYLRQLKVRNLNTNSVLTVAAFKSMDGGWELRNPFFKGCLAPKSISFIRAKRFPPQKVHVFEGFMDFLSMVSQSKTGAIDGDIIVLNSLSNLSKIYPYINQYPYKTLCSWLDNDIAGNQATIKLQQFAATQEALLFQPMNNLYAPHKDVNAWHMHKLGLDS
jgi:hypothetical protein